MAKNTNGMLGIVEVASLLGLRPEYIRAAIRDGKLKSTLAPRSKDSKVEKHFIDPKDVEAWRATVGQNRTTREDGRNKYFFFATQEEVANARKVLKDAGNEAIIEKPQYGKSKSKAKAKPAS